MGQRHFLLFWLSGLHTSQIWSSCKSRNRAISIYCDVPGSPCLSKNGPRQTNSRLLCRSWSYLWLHFWQRLLQTAPPSKVAPFSKTAPGWLHFFSQWMSFIWWKMSSWTFILVQSLRLSMHYLAMYIKTDMWVRNMTCTWVDKRIGWGNDMTDCLFMQSDHSKLGQDMSG